MLYADHPPSTRPPASSRLFWHTTLGAVLVVPDYLYSYFIYKSGGED